MYKLFSAVKGMITKTYQCGQRDGEFRFHLA